MEASEARTAASPSGRAVLAALPEYSAASALSLGARLRGQGVEPTVVAAALTQSRLRARARAKFGDFADGMLFTPAGLEQATRLEVAALHARRYLAAGFTTVADLTCGIGSDAMAMSALGIAVMAFERDEATAVIADHNLRLWPGTVVVLADSLSTVRDVDVEAVFADPGRRTAAGNRRHGSDEYDPPLSALLKLRDRFPALGLKLGPGIRHTDLPADAEAEWVSVDGDVVEAGLWCGPLAGPHGRGALVLRHGSAHRLDGSGVAASVGPVREFLYEPDGAAIRAGLVAEVATIVGGHLVDSTIAYVTAATAVDTPFAVRFRVLDDLPFGVKPLRAYLRARDVGRVTIKKRGTAVTPEALRAQLRLKGDAEATVVLTRVAGAHRALIVEPEQSARP